jgi:acyl carrier protein
MKGVGHMTETVSGRPAIWSREQVHAIISQVSGELAPAGTDGVITADARLVDDLGYHSLALLELAFTIEDEFSLDPIDAETAAGIVTVGDVEDYVAAQLRESGSLADGEAAAAAAADAERPGA